MPSPRLRCTPSVDARPLLGRSLVENSAPTSRSPENIKGPGRTRHLKWAAFRFTGTYPNRSDYSPSGVEPSCCGTPRSDWAARRFADDRHRVAFSVELPRTASACFVPVESVQSATTSVYWPNPMPWTIKATRSSSPSGRRAHACTFARVRATNRRHTALSLVPRVTATSGHRYANPILYTP